MQYLVIINLIVAWICWKSADSWEPKSFMWYLGVALSAANTASAADILF